MSVYISKSGYVSASERCEKFAWLEAHMPDKKAPVDEFTQSLFDNGHKVGQLAKEYLGVEMDVTVHKEDGSVNNEAMLRETAKHMKLGTKVLAEASFRYDGCFCSVDVLVRNDDGTYDLYEVKSSKQQESKKKNPKGVKEKHRKDAAYQRYVLEHCGIPLNRVYLLVLSKDYVRGKTLELDKYFVKVDVTTETAAMQSEVAAKIAELRTAVSHTTEPATVFCEGCNKCPYWAFCSRHVPAPSPFDVYNLDFSEKCRLYAEGVSFFDVPKKKKLGAFAQRQIAYYNRPSDHYIDKAAIKAFLNKLSYPLYSLDFETYQATVPEYEGMRPGEAVPFQYSLHIMKKPDGDYTEGGADLEEHHFLDVSGNDPRRAIAESLVQNIPYGACVVAWSKSVESGIVNKLADLFPDLKDHLQSFSYEDPSEVFRKGDYYAAAMGNRYSIKYVAPALYPNDPSMNYKNLEGDVHNGAQAMAAITMASQMTDEAVAKLRHDLEIYCALDTMAVVKILKRLYEVVK